MPSLAKILVPVDFSGRCRGAVRYAEALGSRFGCQITLLHVLPPPHYELSNLEVGSTVLNELYAARIKQARQDLDAQFREELGHLNVERLLLEGDPARKIVEHAHGEHVSLILMPTHGYGPFRRFILGSVTAKVLHDADCPVLTGVHLEEAPPPKSIAFASVLVALDLGPQSVRALAWGAWLASSTGARLTVIHATPSMEGRAGEYLDPEWRHRLAEDAHQEIARIAGEAGAAPEILIENGDAPGVICSAAESLAADVLVIGRGSAAGIFGRLRTNAYAIIRQSPCPVASV